MKKFVTVLALAAALVSPSVPAAEPDAKPLLNHYAALVQANYEDALSSARTMQRAIRDFLSSPSAETQMAARQAWRTAREYYGTTEAFRFYGGPIDDKRGPEGRINAWPMDESYVDKVDGTGIENVWLGRYLSADGSLLQGPGLRDLVAARDPAQAERTTRRIAASVAAAAAIRAPFDREIIGGRDAPGRQRIQATIDSLVQQSKDLMAAANAVGITKLTLVQH